MDLTIDASGDAEDDVDNNRRPSSPAVLYFEEAAGNAQRPAQPQVQTHASKQPSRTLSPTPATTPDHSRHGSKSNLHADASLGSPLYLTTLMPQASQGPQAPLMPPHLQPKIVHRSPPKRQAAAPPRVYPLSSMAVSGRSATPVTCVHTGGLEVAVRLGHL